MRVFFCTLAFITLWQFLPEYAFPMLGSMAFLCWVAPKNAVANFIGSGLGGMGFMNLSFDWSNICKTYNLFLTPWWTQVVIFTAFVVHCWIPIPAAKFGNLGSYKHGLMSNRLLRGRLLFQMLRTGRPPAVSLPENATVYPVGQLLGSDAQFNQTVYDETGPIYVGTQFRWRLFFDHA